MSVPRRKPVLHLQGAFEGKGKRRRPKKAGKKVAVLPALHIEAQSYNVL
jgi:hypothetical protein